ncbi:hypothetical protein A7976_13610 [Methylobacillus sp. MM3]|nr:hypothetical protein A7976_13610 [Methylobacillus sp. MM3]
MERLDQSSFFGSESTVGAAFARFFSYSVLTELAKQGHSKIAGRIFHQYNLNERFTPETTVADFYDALFMQLNKEYRHEYIYKNAIAEKVLLGKHNLNTAFMQTEFGVDCCKADVVVLNGTSHVYEIKSEMDNFDRLERQLSAYKKVFDLITVITTENLYQAVESRVDQTIGIMVLAKTGYKFKKTPYREPISNVKNVHSSVIFDSLHRKEYLQIIEEILAVDLQDVPNTQIYEIAKSYFSKIDPEIAHAEMVRAIKKRQGAFKVSEFIHEVPSSLKAAYLSLKLSKSENHKFLDLLKNNISVAFG